jgi:hypothetical protein
MSSNGQKLSQGSAIVVAMAYLVWMLGVPCMPVADTLGQVIAIPRWEFWLIHVSAPSAIVWQWTAGFQPVEFADRLPVFLMVGVWLIHSWLIGMTFLRNEYGIPFAKNDRIVRTCVGILIGNTFLSGLIFLFATCFSTQSWWLFLILIWCMIGATHLRSTIRWRNFWKRTETHQLESDGIAAGVMVSNQMVSMVSNHMISDLSMTHTLYRRAVGLLMIASLWLVSVQVYGASIPSADNQVRVQDWWLVRHTIQDQRLHFRDDNLQANGPNATVMNSLFAAGLHGCVYRARSMSRENALVAGSWGVQSKAQQESLWVGVSAGKVINAILCVVGIVLLGSYLRDQFGLLPSLFTCFLLLATPGLSELSRFGRSDYLPGIYAVAFIVVRADCRRSSKSITDSRAWWMLLGSSFGAGYGTALMAGVPAIFVMLVEWRSKRSKPKRPQTQSIVPFRPFNAHALRFIIVLISFLIVSIPSYARNLIASGDPVSPWGRIIAESVGVIPMTDSITLLRRSIAVPSMTVDEWHIAQEEGSDLSLSSQRGLRSAYRWANLWDGIERFVWRSNAHGLMLIPMALIGLVVCRDQRHVNATILISCWSVYWLGCWWLFSERTDREWVGLLFLWAISSGSAIGWMMQRIRPIWISGWIAVVILWSVISIPIWPTSDNRFLVSRQSIQQPIVEAHTDSSIDLKRDIVRQDNDPARTTPSLSSLINPLAELNGSLKDQSRILMVGDHDDFGLVPPTCSQDPFRESVLDREQLKLEKVTHVLFLWDRIADFDRQMGLDREKSYRKVIDQWRTNDFIVSVRLETEGSYAQLFQMNEIRLQDTIIPR